jgi:hypothetical protein
MAVKLGRYVDPRAVIVLSKILQLTRSRRVMIELNPNIFTKCEFCQNSGKFNYFPGSAGFPCYLLYICESLCIYTLSHHSQMARRMAVKLRGYVDPRG